MDNSLGVSELVLSPNGEVYHLRISPEKMADNIILVGDPKRVEMISKEMDSVEFRGENREMVYATGYYKQKRITALSTGMGTDNLDIVINELDAVANIDLREKKVLEEKKSLNIIRIGTSGSLQEDLDCGEFIASEYSVGLDGMFYFYRDDNKVIDLQGTDSFISFMNWSSTLPKPYMVNSSDNLLNRLAFDMPKGITATSPGFYAPQGREIRLPLAFKDINSRLSDFTYNNLKITNYEMESSALYALGRALGHNVLTICLIIANRKKSQFLSDYNPRMRELIRIVLDRI